MQVKVLVPLSCPTLCNPMDCSLPASSVHEIFQAIVLEWIAISFSRNAPITGSLFHMAKNIYHWYWTGVVLSNHLLNLTQKLNALQFYHSFHSAILSMALSTWLMMMICSTNWFLGREISQGLYSESWAHVSHNILEHLSVYMWQYAKNIVWPRLTNSVSAF